MGFLKKYNDANSEWKLAVKYLYGVLKKKKLYSRYKASFYPPTFSQLDNRFLTSVPEIYFDCGKEHLYYRGDRDIRYLDFKFFRVLKNFQALLLRGNATGEIRNSEITMEFPQIYFTHNYKGKKLPIKDRIFCLRFGLVASCLASILQVDLVHACSPEIVTDFILLSILITLMAMFVLFLFSLAFRNR